MITPPPLRNDCFALPPGVDWVPMDTALAHLRARLHPVVGKESVPLAKACGRILSADVTARRANPPAANSAVDGYAFRGPIPEGAAELPLIEGRAAAGAPLTGEVPEGAAVRILTGAILPAGVDTVVLEEDTTTDGERIALRGPLKAGVNTRRAGEDVTAGDTILTAGRCLRAPDMALLAAVGVAEVQVCRRLRVGVLSTGDEVTGVTDTAPEEMPEGRIYDANRPMLLALLAGWGLEAVDLGHVRDDRAALRARLDEAAGQVDAILTSGGASAGEEDHVSALLGAEGVRHTWRIAVKPGRPLALGLWNGAPIFGLPGNPVAAFVCTLLFARPALGVMAGGEWLEPVGYPLPAAFEKDKKPGRREFLRARVNAEGAAEVFRSEGSGRISGLSWSDGLVEIGDAARQIRPGDMVRFIPYGSFAF